MSEMSAREVLAQAIWASEEPVMSWGFVNEKRRGEYRHQADCALKALRAKRYAVVELPRSLPVTPEVQSGCEHTCLIGSDLLAAAAAAARDSEER